MMRALLALLFVCGLTACVTGSPSADLVVRDVTIYPGDGAPFVGSVVVRGETIVAVERGSGGLPATAQVIDAPGNAADFVLLEGDAGADIRLTGTQRAVYRAGKRVDQH